MSALSRCLAIQEFVFGPGRLHLKRVMVPPHPNPLPQGEREKFCDWYVPDHTHWGDPRVSPQHATNHANLPPTFIQTAEFDPLRDEGRNYADTLRAAGNIVEYKCYPGMVHGFARMAAKIDLAKTALDDAARALRAALCD